jgi:hypothetical protein
VSNARRILLALSMHKCAYCLVFPQESPKRATFELWSPLILFSLACALSAQRCGSISVSNMDSQIRQLPDYVKTVVVKGMAQFYFTAKLNIFNFIFHLIFKFKKLILWNRLQRTRQNSAFT